MLSPRAWVSFARGKSIHKSSILNINIEDESEDNSDQYNDRSKYCNRGNECNEDNYDNDRSIIYEDDVKDDSYYDYDEKFHI